MTSLKIFLHDYAGHPAPVELSRELAKRGHKVAHAYFVGDTGPKGVMQRAADDPEGLSFVPIGIGEDYTKTSFVKRRFQDVEYGRAAAAAIEAAKPDIVISGNTPTESQTGVVKASRQNGSRFIYWCQDFYSIAVSKILSQKLPGIGSAIGGYYKILERKQFLDADGVLMITEDFKDQTRKWGVAEDKMHVIPNWGAIDEIPTRPKANGWAKKHGLDDKFVFLYSGTLGLKHNPELLISLARDLESDADARVVVVSSGSGVEVLEQAKTAEALDNLIVLPLQPFEDFPDVLGSADVLLGVIEREAGVFSVPSKILSYLCSGRPIMLAAPRQNLAARSVATADCGAIVEPEDIDGWRAAAKQMQADGENTAAIGARGRAYAEHNFDIKVVADRFEAMFAATMGSKQRAA